METLTRDYSLSKSLRVPAVSLTNKRHNVKVGRSFGAKALLALDDQSPNPVSSWYPVSLVVDTVSGL